MVFIGVDEDKAWDMTPRECIRKYAAYLKKWDLRGIQLARIITPVVNVHVKKEDQLKPYNLWPSNRIKPDKVLEKERKELAKETFEEFGVEAIPPKKRDKN